jgi:hypothetical protein
MIEKWLSLERTVDFVKTVTVSSLGPACQTLISICESGSVRARWTDHYMKTLPAIHKRDWIGADIDWKNFRVVKADGAGMAGVDFSEDDLNTWASKISAKKPAIETAAPAPCADGGKRKLRAVAQEAIKACFPEQGGDVDLPDGPFLKRIFGWLEKERPAFASMSNRTVLRAAGRAK